jgi:hypothetical protein
MKSKPYGCQAWRWCMSYFSCVQLFLPYYLHKKLSCMLLFLTKTRHMKYHWPDSAISRKVSFSCRTHFTSFFFGDKSLSLVLPLFTNVKFIRYFKINQMRAKIKLIYRLKRVYIHAFMKKKLKDLTLDWWRKGAVEINQLASSIRPLLPHAHLAERPLCKWRSFASVRSTVDNLHLDHLLDDRSRSPAEILRG